jgi:asparagine synthase (glutamine-hydrolysing)
MQTHLSREQIEARGLFRVPAVEEILRALERGRRDVSLHVWALIMLEQWFREYGESVRV